MWRNAGTLRDPELRRARLQEELLHVLALPSFVAELHRQPEYAVNGHAGVLLVKTAELRVVLEVVRCGAVLASVAVHGPAVLQVLEGELVIQTPQGPVRAMRSDLVALPREERRSLAALRDSSFLLVLSPGAELGECERGG